jgi:hypothetical protein
VCWQEREDVDNGVCGSCSATLSKRVTTLAIENARLREILREIKGLAVFPETEAEGYIYKLARAALSEESDGSPG